MVEQRHSTTYMGQVMGSNLHERRHVLPHGKKTPIPFTFAKLGKEGEKSQILRSW